MQSRVKLSRKREARQALLRSLAISLILHEKIRTTSAKAKALKPIMERLVEKAKKGGLLARRALTREIGFGPAVLKMTKVIGPKYKARVGGYLRVVRLSRRRSGDNAPMAQVEWVEIEKGVRSGE